MPVIYRRPNPADTAAARIRLAGLTQSPAGRLSQHPLESSDTAALQDPGPTRWPAASGPNPAAYVGPAYGGPASVPAYDPPAPSPPAQPSPPAALVAPWSAWRAHFTPRHLRGARLDPGRRGMAAVAVVAVLAAAVAGIGVWRSRPHAIAVTAPHLTPAATSPSASSGPALVVAVAGGVRHPGLFTLPVGSRVADAIAAAGGVRPGSTIGLLNLARRLVDGEQVIVGADPPALSGSPGAPGASQSGPGTLLNLNTATLEQLDALPGVGPVLAQRILDYRTQHGAFRSVDQLRDVGGIGEAKFADLKALVSV